VKAANLSEVGMFVHIHVSIVYVHTCMSACVIRACVIRACVIRAYMHECLCDTMLQYP